MKKPSLIGLGLITGIALALPFAALADSPTPGMVNSPHDFTTQTNFWVSGVTNWIPNNNVCEECHTIHKAVSSYKNAGPLWAHEGTGAPPTYTAFTSPKLTAAGYPSGGTPGWSSLACLSCHDGILALNQLNGKSTPATPVNIATVASFAVITAGAAGGPTDISGTHPVGVDYNTCQAADSTGLFPASTPVANAGADTGKTIQAFLLFNETTEGGGSAMVECASCHDIHQQQGTSALATSGVLSHRDAVKIGTATSTQALCLTCHNK
jgi:hypothetical protein